MKGMSNETEYEGRSSRSGAENTSYEYVNDGFSYKWPEHFDLIDRINRKYVLFVALIVSLIGNSLIVLILGRKKNRNNSTAVFLLSLAASDLTITVYMFLSWFEYEYFFGHFPLNTFTCRLFNILYDVGLYTNPWIMCIVSVERAISVTKPHKVKTICTMTRARGITSFLWFFCIVLFSLYNQIIVSFVTPDGKVECAVYEENIVFVNMHTIANIFLQFIIPYIVILSSCIIIIVALYKKSIRKSKSVSEQRLSVTKKLLLVNFAFLICVTQVIVFESLDLYKQQIMESYTLEDFLYAGFYLYLFRTLRVVNSGVNFFIYFFNGTRFRKDTLDLFRCSCISKSKNGYNS